MVHVTQAPHRDSVSVTLDGSNLHVLRVSVKMIAIITPWQPVRNHLREACPDVLIVPNHIWVIGVSCPVTMATALEMLMVTGTVSVTTATVVLGVQICVMDAAHVRMTANVTVVMMDIGETTANYVDVLEWVKIAADMDHAKVNISVHTKIVLLSQNKIYVVVY